MTFLQRQWTRLRERMAGPPEDEDPRTRLGRRGEELAALHLKSHGHKILRRNFRGPHGGEVDIVCRDRARDELVFIEVKTRRSEHFGLPHEAVDRKKRQLILRGAMAWLRLLDMPDLTFRFDVVEVLLDEDDPSRATEIHHHKDAFPLPDRYTY